MGRNAQRAFVLILAATSTATCKNSTGGGGPTPTFLVASPDSVALLRFDSVRLSVSVLDQDSALLTGISVTFQSSDTVIAKVSNTGVINSSGPVGHTTIVVTATNLHKNVPVTVTTSPVSIMVSPLDTAVRQGASYQLRTVVVDSFGDSVANAPRLFLSLDTAVAAVSASGMVTAKDVGQATLKVSSGAIFTFATVTSLDTTGAVSITLSPLDTTVYQGASYQLRTVVVDSLGDSVPNVHRAFHSSDTAVAAISASGVVTAKVPGLAFLSVTSTGLFTSTTVTVLDTNVVARVPLANAPYGVAASSAGVVYIAPILGPSVRRLDMTTFTLTDAIVVGGDPAQVAFAGAGATALVTKRASGSIGIIDVATHAQVDTIAIPGNPYPVRISADGLSAYVTSTAGWLYKVDIASKTRIDSVFSADPSLQIALGPGDSLLYVAQQLAGVVNEFRTATMALVRTFTTGGRPQGLAVSQDGAELYIADEVGPLRIWSLASATEIDTVSTGGGTFGVALTPDGTKLFVGSTLGSIFLVNRVTRAIIHRLDVGGTPRNIAVDPITGYAVVPNEAGSWIDVVK